MALKGAEETIRSSNQIAISLYHKPWDFAESQEFYLNWL